MEIFERWKDIEPLLKEKKAEVNVFYTEEYYNLEVGRGNRCIYIFDDRGLILVVIWRRLIYNWGVMPSEPVYFLEVDEKAFLNDVMEAIKGKIYWLNQTGATANFKAFPSKSIRIPFGNYICDLSLDKEELFSRVTSKARNMIRKGEKDGVVIIHGGIELLNDYVSCDTETWERSGIKRNAENVYEQYLKQLNQHAVIYLAKKEGVVQGGALFIFNEMMSYYLYGASIKHPSPGSMNQLQWNAMLDFKAQGVKFHNFVGCRINEDPDSKYHGIQKFKASFGGELVQGYMFKTILNETMYKQFKVAEAIRHPGKKSAGDIIDQEIHKWRELNVDN